MERAWQFFQMCPSFIEIEHQLQVVSKLRTTVTVLLTYYTICKKKKTKTSVENFFKHLALLLTDRSTPNYPTIRNQDDIR